MSGDDTGKPNTAKPTFTDKEKLDATFAAIHRAAGGRGWHSNEIARDTTKNRYGTVAVSRWSPNAFRATTATIEVTVSPKLEVRYHITSPYDDGLEDFWNSLRRELEELPWIESLVTTGDSSKVDATAGSAEQLLIRLLRRFHNVVKQMRNRHDDRETLLVKDEYDVQDLLHAVLRGLFDDVRPEEYVPSYAGGSSRLDFLLKAEKAVVEVKLASEKLRDKQIGEQLLIDIGRYSGHRDCKTLICFVYDPGGFLRNPAGLEADLTGDRDGLRVVTVALSI